MVRARVLVISDTHGHNFDYSHLPPVDVAIHCGDLTDGSTIDEFKTTLDALRRVKADTKLVIAGNHDFTLDQPTFREKIKPFTAAEYESVFGAPGDAERLFDDDSEVRLLSEGTHRIDVKGARLVVYASPYTQFENGSGWGFTFDPHVDHDWDIASDTDVVITHSPPQGMFDRLHSGERAGSAGLFAAVAAIRPKLHCFGHVHRGWGAKLVHWRPCPEGVTLSHFNAIDNEKSVIVETLSTFTRTDNDRARVCREQGYIDAQCPATGSDHTLFMNAAIQGCMEGEAQHLPWIAEIEL